tara:strand:- start:336 stop:530 length:195 start_codon:yes stop_codon:yes gene_type:complete
MWIKNNNIFMKEFLLITLVAFLASCGSGVEASDVVETTVDSVAVEVEVVDSVVTETAVVDSLAK